MRYFEFSSQRNSVLTSVIDKSDVKKKKLKQLCRTRWVERISSYENFWELFAEVSLNSKIKYEENAHAKAMQLL